MRLFVFASALSVLALATLAVTPATAAKSKMGCERGKEVWNAATGKCVAGKSKAKKVAAAKPAAKKPAAKAPAKK